MRMITKAIFKEMATVAAITLLGLVVLVLLQQAVRLADLITKQGVSPLSIVPILALALPALVVTILPVCSLMSPALTYSRLATDGELLALKATGYSFYQLLTPVLGLGVFMGVVTALLVLAVIPHANFLARQWVFEAVSMSLQLRVRERVFQSPLPGLVEAAAVDARHLRSHGAQVRRYLAAMVHAVVRDDGQVHEVRQLEHAEEVHRAEQFVGGHLLVPAAERRILEQVDHLDAIPPREVLVANFLQIRKRPHGLWRLPGDVEPKVEPLSHACRPKRRVPWAPAGCRRPCPSSGTRELGASEASRATSIHRATGAADARSPRS